MDYNYKVIRGSEIPAMNLRLPRAISIYRSVTKHPCATLISCRRNRLESEIIIVSLSKLGTPDMPVYPIQDSEDVAIICDKKDIELPKVYALRKDFPAGLPHSNATDNMHPVSLCVSDVMFSDYRQQFSAHDFLEYICNWFRGNSMGALHEKDRPIEVFFVFQKFCYITKSLFSQYSYGRLRKITDLTYTLEYTEKDNANYLLLSIPSSIEISTNFAFKPKSIGDLAGFNDLAGLSIPKTIISMLMSKNTRLNIPFLIIFYATQKRSVHSKEESTQLFIVKTNQNTYDIFTKHKQFSKEHFISWFNNIPIEIIFCLPAINIEKNAIYNGMEVQFNKITFIGTGTIGSKILDYFVREGVSREIAIADFDILFPHNIARHVLDVKDLMQYKVRSLREHYSGIENQKIIPILGNYLDLSSTQRQQALDNTELIVDASTSVAVERHLAFGFYDKGARCCTVFINPKGTDLVLLIEDSERNQRLDLLEMSYLYNLILLPEMEHHLDVADTQRTNNFSCRSESSIMSYDNIGMLSAIASQQIKKIVKSDKSFIGIWRVNADDSTISKHELGQQLWTRIEINPVIIYVTDMVQQAMEKYASLQSEMETGGCLFGCYDKDRNIIYVLFATSPPPDSQISETSFIRGCEGMKELGEDISKRTFNQVCYLGEWHSHPGCTNSPSETDLKQFTQRSEESENLDIPFVQAIWGNNGLYINAII